jgi:zinc protease
MHDDKKPSKYIWLAFLFLAILIGILAFYGLRAQAAPGRFLDIQEVKTQSGISVWLVEDKTLPVIALQYLFLDSGTALDPDAKQGLVRMLSNTMDEGAGDLDSQSFQKALADNSITLTFSAGRDGFGGQVKTLTRNKDVAFDLLQKALGAPRFDAEPLERMRAANIARLKSSMGEPEWMAARLINDRMFENHPYGKNSGGTLSGLATITADDLRAFKNNHLSKDRLLIAIVGDIDAATVRTEMDRIFTGLPQEAEGGTIPDTSIHNAGKIYLHEQPIPQTIIEAALPAFGREDADYYALQVMNYIFGGGGFGSRLMDEVREKRGLTYGIYSSLNNYRHIDTLGISTSTKNESAGEVLKIIRDTMIAMQNTPVSDKELSAAKSYITGSMPLALSSTDQIAGLMLNLRVEGVGIDYLDGFAEKINAVSAADIQRVAKRVLNPDAMVTVLVGQPKEIENATTIESLPNVR